MQYLDDAINNKFRPGFIELNDSLLSISTDLQIDFHLNYTPRHKCQIIYLTHLEYYVGVASGRLKVLFGKAYYKGFEFRIRC